MISNLCVQLLQINTNIGINASFDTWMYYKHKDNQNEEIIITVFVRKTNNICRTNGKLFIVKQSCTWVFIDILKHFVLVINAESATSYGIIITIISNET